MSLNCETRPNDIFIACASEIIAQLHYLEVVKGVHKYLLRPFEGRGWLDEAGVTGCLCAYATTRRMAESKFGNPLTCRSILNF